MSAQPLSSATAAAWPRGRAIAPLALLLAVAAGLRLGWPGFHQFDFDQAQVSLAALRMARLGEPATLGMVSSAGLPNFPGAVWLYAVVFGFSPDPLAASLATGLVNVLAVGVIWWVAHRAWGPGPALLAGLLLAASPYAAFYSRDIWSQDLLIPLAAAWLWAAASALTGAGRWPVFAAVALAGFAPQVHYAGAALLAPTLIVAARGRWWRIGPAGAALAGLLTAGLLAAPTLYTVACCRPEVLAQAGAASRTPLVFSLEAAAHWLDLGLARGWEWYVLGPDWAWPTPLAEILAAASLVLAGLAALGVAYIGREIAGFSRSVDLTPAQALAWAAGALAVGAPALFLLHRPPVFPHYQLASLPAFFLLAGAAGRWPWPRWAAAALWASLVVVCAAQVVAVAQAFDQASRVARPGGLGTPLSYARAAAQAARADGRRVIVHTAGDDAAVVGDVAAFDVLLWEHPHQAVDARSVLLLPAGGARLLFLRPDLPAVEELAGAGLPASTLEAPRRAGDAPYLLVDYAGLAPSGFTPVTPPVTFDNGARLIGWRARPLAGRLRLTLVWQIATAPAPGDFHVFNHLLTAGGGEPVAVGDGPASSAAWRAGDTVLTWADFERPAAPGPYTFGVGLYAWPAVERAASVDRPGDPWAPVFLGPMDWPEAAP